MPPTTSKRIFNTPVMVRAEKKSVRKMSLGRALLFYVASALVGIVIIVSLWISVSAIREKIKIGKGVSQIVNVVELTRRMATTERAVGMIDREDLILHLMRMKQIQDAVENKGKQILINPWNGSLTAYVVAANLFRVETIVPSRICKRVVGLLTNDMSSLGLLRQIDTNDGDGWRQVYTEAMNATLKKEAVNAGCSRDRNVNLALTFTLR